MTEYVWTLFGQQDTGLTLTASAGTATDAMEFTLSQDARLTAIWFYSPSSATTLPAQCGIYLVSTEALIIANENPAWSGDAGSGWVSCTFDGSFQLLANTAYKVAVYTGNATSYFSVTSGFWTTGTGASGLTNGIITAPNNADAAQGQGSYSGTSGGLTYPGSSGAGQQFWMDVQVTTGIPAATSPVPGFGLSTPRTWSSGDLVTTPRLRADMYNLAALNGQARPFFGATVDNQEIANGVSLVEKNGAYANNWFQLLTQGAAPVLAGAGTATMYPIPLAGWYLAQGWVAGAPVSGGSDTTEYNWGVVYTQGTALAASKTDLGQMAGPAATFGTPVYITQSGMELLPFNPETGDCIGTYGVTSNSNGAYLFADWNIEWVGMPGSATINGYPYSGPTGVVVTSPKPATLWPPGPGGTLTAAVAAGATTITMPPIPGMRAGQTIGLDWQNSQNAQAYAEIATISSIAGATVTLDSALGYAHSAGAPVAVPVSAALLNEQIRDNNNFWFYPPMLRAVQGTASAQAVTTATWTTINLALSGSGIVNTLDNFTGWATVTSNSYTIPVSGLYLCCGQINFIGTSATTNWGARLIDNNGVTYDGDFYTTSGNTLQAPSVRRLIRLTAGQTIALQGYQSSGSTVDTGPSITLQTGLTSIWLPRLIIIFRAF